MEKDLTETQMPGRHRDAERQTPEALNLSGGWQCEQAIYDLKLCLALHVGYLLGCSVMFGCGFE